jgi:hypothetical protein
LKICQFLVRNGRLVRNSIALKIQVSFQKFASTFGDKLLLQSVEKCNAVLRRDGFTIFQIVYMQNSIFVPEDRSQNLA